MISAVNISDTICKVTTVQHPDEALSRPFHIPPPVKWKLLLFWLIQLAVLQWLAGRLLVMFSLHDLPIRQG